MRIERHRAILGSILAVGLAVALAVYVTAAGQPAAQDSDVIDWEQSKVYERQVEVIGGKAAVVGNELRAFFGSLWHGRRLAGTIVALTGLVALGYYVVEGPFPPARPRG
jgi:hypothetical protein